MIYHLDPNPEFCAWNIIDKKWLEFQNKEERLQAVFVCGRDDGRVFVSGSVNWAKANRHFRLEMCQNNQQLGSGTNPVNSMSSLTTHKTISLDFLLLC